MINPDDFFPAYEDSEPAPGGLGFYGAILLSVFALVLAAFLVECETSINSTGILRPETERAEVKCLVQGKILSLNFFEGKRVNTGECIAVLNDTDLKAKIELHKKEIRRLNTLMNDLTKLLAQGTSLSNISAVIPETPQVGKQLMLLYMRCAEQELAIQRLRKEVETNDYLAAGKTIAPNEVFQKQKILEQTEVTAQVLILEQVNLWQKELSEAQIQIEEQKTLVKSYQGELVKYQITAPVSGIVDQAMVLYNNSPVLPGDIICSITPDSPFVIESFIPTSSIGKMKIGQTISAVTDNADARYSNRIIGNITSISDDFILRNGIPVYKVKCKIEMDNSGQFQSILKKGMTLRCRFITGKKTIAALLLGRIKNTLSP